MVESTVPPIVVTGCGTVSAAGTSCKSSLQSLRSFEANNTHLSNYYFPVPFSAPCFLVKDDDLPTGGLLSLPEYAAELPYNRTLFLALCAINEALTTAGVDKDILSTKRVGVALGTTVGCTFHNESYYVDWKNKTNPDPNLLQKYFTSNLAARIQNIIGVQGPKIVVTNACASGTDAIGIAKSWLEHGLCDIAIAGGVDEISRIACHGFKSLMLVSEESCKPFDKNRKGLNLGEGAGIVVLEQEDYAVSRDSSILGWIRGYGIAGDAHHPTAPHPEGKGLKNAVLKALKSAALTTENISMINAHGTGTPANDKAETRAILDMGFDRLMPVVSTKGATGHTLGAAGGIEAIFTLLSLNRGEVAGTTGCTEFDSDLSFTPIVEGQTAQLEGRVGISQSLAFGGSNSALVIEGSGK